MRSSITFAAACLAVAACGCTSGTGVVRAQSPQYGPQSAPTRTAAYSAPAGQPSAIQQTGGHHRGIRATPVYDATLGQHAAYQTAHFDGHSGMGQSEFPVSNGGCPGGACGQGGYCGPGGGCSPLNPSFVRDARSYSYCQPKDLRYPNANAVGGAVAYPYYTHKGPSDFFRQ